MRELDLRGPRSRRIVIDTEGAMLGPDCVLVRRTPEGYRCTTRDEAAAIQGFLRHGAEDPDWLFRQCRRIAKALADGHIALAQVYGLFIPTDGLNDGQLKQVALIAPFIKANFNPDEPRDPDGRWTDEGGAASGLPSPTTPAPSAHSANALVNPRDPNAGEVQVAADNRRQNKMVTDIVVGLGLRKDQRQELHHAISGQDLTYRPCQGYVH